MISSSENLDIFSPKKFDEYVGQIRAKKIAQVMVSAAAIDRRPLPNIMIDGSYGTGKTALAKVIQIESGNSKPQILDAASLNKEIPFFSKTIIIDEIHNLDPQVADSFNIMLDQDRAHIIGCTTNPGALPAAFRSRFRSIHLERYTENEIKQILYLVITRKEIPADNKVLAEIAKRSRLNPRVALNNLSFILDYNTVSGAPYVVSRLAQEAFGALGIDANGFTDRDYQYMKALPPDRPVGIHYLSSVLGVDTKTIEAEIEPFLLQTGHIDRMPRGRVKLKDL